MAASIVSSAADATQPSRYTEGHSDLRINYDASEDRWQFIVRCEGCTLDGVVPPTDVELSPNDVVIVVPPTTVTLAQENAFIDDTLTGAEADQPYLKLPQAQAEASNEEAPFLGVSREGISTGVFQSDEITLRLESVSFFTGGEAHFSLFSSDAGLGFPLPHFWFSSLDSGATQNGDNSIDLTVGGGSHSHFNLGFSERGVYDVTFSAEGTLLGGGTTSGTGTYRFLVAVAEPIPLLPGPALLLAMALGFGASAAWVLRRRGGRRSA